jgi:arylsulfatase A-like enzyme
LPAASHCPLRAGTGCDKHSQPVAGTESLLQAILKTASGIPSRFPHGSQGARRCAQYHRDSGDDLGYADISPYGAEIRTPNIQQLADTGVRYNHFTVTAMCSPTRAALLTGLNHHSAGVGWVGEWDFGYPGYRGELAPDAVTLPQILQQHGYATYAAGKWHLTNGEHRSRIGPFDSWPTQKGFDRYWGFMEGETDQFEPAVIVSGNEVQDMPKDAGLLFS